MLVLMRKNLKIRNLVDAIGVSPNAVSQWNTGKHVPSALVLMDICDYLECEPQDIYPEE